MKPAIQIIIENGKLTKSFFGGKPEVPGDFKWPIWDASNLYLNEIEYIEENCRKYGTVNWKAKLEENRKKLLDPLVPLTFLAQIYLEEIPRFDNFPNLPSSGILYLFWEALLYPSGHRPSSKGSCQVIFAKNISELHPATFPLKMIEKFSDILDIQDVKEASDISYSISFKPSWVSSNYLETILNVYCEDEDDFADEPSDETFLEPFLKEALEDIPNRFPERDKSTILIKYPSSPGKSIHYLFGSPMVIQNPMEEMCQVAFHGFDATEFKVDFSPEVAHLKDGVADWQLLIQIDSDDYFDWCWGDLGIIYFWIRKQDLEKQDFSNVWAEMQCY